MHGSPFTRLTKSTRPPAHNSLRASAKTICAMMIGVVLSTTPLLAQTNRFDAAADFSLSGNPNGAWTYGWMPPAGGALTPFSNSGTGPLEPNANAVSYWNTGAASWGAYHAAFANLTSTASTVSQGLILEPGVMALHPANDGKLAVARFTAPADGQYAVSAVFKNLDDQARNTQALIVHSGVRLLERILSGAGAETTSSRIFVLRSGDTLDFAVGNGGDGFGNDAVQLTATLDRTDAPSPPQLSGGQEGPLTDVDTVSTGTLRLIGAFVDFSDAPGDANADFNALWNKFVGNGSLVTLIKSQSTDKTSMTASVVAGWRRMPQPLSYYFPSGQGWKYADYIDHAANLYSDQRPVTNGTVMVVVPPVSAAGFTAGSGAHQIGGSGGWWGMRRVVTLAPAAYSEHYTTLAHELGHCFGLGELYPATGSFHEVGGFDLMGDVVYATGFLGWHRHKFLWMDGPRKPYLSAAGTYVATLEPLSNSNGINMLVVPDKTANVASPAKVWVVEVNQDLVTRDDYIAGNGNKLVTAGDGVLIYSVETPPQTDKRELRLIQQGAENTWKNLQTDPTAALYKVGAVFDRTDAPLKVTVTGKSQTGFVVEVVIKQR